MCGLVHVLRPGAEAHKLHDEVVDTHHHNAEILHGEVDVNHQAGTDDAEEIVGELAFAAQHHIDDADDGRDDGADHTRLDRAGRQVGCESPKASVLEVSKVTVVMITQTVTSQMMSKGFHPESSS